MGAKFKMCTNPLHKEIKVKQGLSR